MLTDAGYSVATAEDIDAALTELHAAPFDLILSDIKFSDNEFEGFAFFKKSRDAAVRRPPVHLHERPD